MPPKLLIATHNRGKLLEYRALLVGLPYELVTLDDVGIRDDVEESGATFEENARLKALTYARMSGLLTLADDSGLEVDALDGEPGVRSRRYAGDKAGDAERIRFLLSIMRAVPDEQRSARFRCVIVIADGAGKTWTSEGTCEGKVAPAPRGTNGFGYDPVFLMADENYARTMAELPDEEKNRVSHRGRAARGARQALEKISRRER